MPRPGSGPPRSWTARHPEKSHASIAAEHHQLSRSHSGCHPDHLGTPQRLTDRHQQIVWDAVYAPFGEVTLRTEQVMQPLRFPGQYADPETGLHQNWHRDYDPALGRYLQSDPIGLNGGINTYAYALDNPVSYADPLGLDAYVGQHGALFPSNPLNHTAIVLRPNNPLVFANHPLFVATRGMQATLGGQPGGSGAIGFFGSLNSAPNYLGDDPEGLTELIPVACPNGLDDTAFINSLIDAANRYGNNLRYDPFPDPFGLTYNSNSYVSGVIRAAGGIPPALPGSQPGYDRPIPIGP
jgi:RHS repeat-associated protein